MRPIDAERLNGELCKLKTYGWDPESGEWGAPQCSSCKGDLYGGENYCPYCGAKFAVYE